MTDADGRKLKPKSSNSVTRFLFIKHIIFSVRQNTLWFTAEILLKNKYSGKLSLSPSLTSILPIVTLDRLTLFDAHKTRHIHIRGHTHTHLTFVNFAFSSFYTEERWEKGIEQQEEEIHENNIRKQKEGESKNINTSHRLTSSAVRSNPWTEASKFQSPENETDPRIRTTRSKG